MILKLEKIVVGFDFVLVKIEHIKRKDLKKILMERWL